MFPIVKTVWKELKPLLLKQALWLYLGKVIHLWWLVHLHTSHIPECNFDMDINDINIDN